MEGVVMTPDFWEGRKVLVTGHTGFKGAWLGLWLNMLGAEVVGYSLDPPTDPNLFDVSGLGEEIHSIRADVRNIEALCDAVDAGGFDVIFHLAAQSLVRASYEDPICTYTTNVMGTANVLEAVRRAGTNPAVVIVTSDKCYENHERPKPYREDDPMGGHDPYSSSKGCAELVVSSYRRSFFPGANAPVVASVRAGNVIGGGDWALDRLVPDCIEAFSSSPSRVIPIRNPNAVRPWQHVLEPLGGYLLVAERLTTDGREFAEAWNFGPQKSDVRTVEHVAKRTAELWGGGADVEIDTRKHPHEAALLMLDCSKARDKLGWRSRTDLDQALRWTVEWHKAVARGQDARRLCLEQIRTFMEMKT